MRLGWSEKGCLLFQAFAVWFVVQAVGCGLSRGFLIGNYNIFQSAFEVVSGENLSIFLFGIVRW